MSRYPSRRQSLRTQLQQGRAGAPRAASPGERHCERDLNTQAETHGAAFSTAGDRLRTGKLKTGHPQTGQPKNGLAQTGLAQTGLAQTGLAMPQWLVDRRRMLKLTASAVVAAAAPLGTNVTPAIARPAPGRKFFTRREYAILRIFAEMIIPKDEVSGGAQAAKVPEFLDARVAETIDPTIRQSWRDDLEEIDRLSRVYYGRRFTRAGSRRRSRLMQRLSRNEANPKRDGEYAFGTIKWEVCDVYYRTEIGIHEDLKYQGNQIQDEYFGTDVSGQPAMPEGTPATVGAVRD